MTFSPPGHVIFVDDDPLVRTATVQSLDLAGLNVTPFESAREALQQIDSDFNGVIVTDIRMPDIDGLQFFRAVQEIDPTIPVILITGHGDVPMAVAALRDGVDDFITKPFASNHLIASIQRGIERRRLELDNRMLRARIADDESNASPLIGESAAIVRLREAITQVAEADVDVLIEGETGVGKELVALILHRQSRRRSQPFVNVNCAALASGAASPRLMGNAPSPGRMPSPGLIEAAHRGTLFLDEVDQLDPDSQPLVLRAIEDKQVTHAGASSPSPIDVRLIAATRRNLREAVDAGQFREDFFYAINVVRLRIPPLRERRADIPLLFAHFVDEAAKQLRRSPTPMSDQTRRHLIEHDWPGNVRELRSFAFQTIVGFADKAAPLNKDDQPSLPQRVERFEASAIRSALDDCRGNAAEAMKRLGVPRKTFYDKLRRHGIDINAYRSDDRS